MPASSNQAHGQDLMETEEWARCPDGAPEEVRSTWQAVLGYIRAGVEATVARKVEERSQKDARDTILREYVGDVDLHDPPMFLGEDGTPGEPYPMTLE
eukprot:Nk52_evm1s2199 gene=Nk52_evmTU1s2199